MSSAILKTRLRDAANTLQQTVTVLSSATTIPTKAENRIKHIASRAPDLQAAADLVDVRDCALARLKELRNEAKIGSTHVQLVAGNVPFHHARFLLFQAYISTAWAVSDLATGVAGLALALPGQAATKSANLHADFISKESKAMSHATTTVLRECYGFPVSVAYAVRNHFVHDGAHDRGSLFDGDAPADGFAPSDSGLKWIEKRVALYGCDSGQTRVASAWPWSPNDLLDLVDVAVGEMDDALGIVVSTTAHEFGVRASLLAARDAP